MNSIPFHKTKLIGGFWKERQDVVLSTSLESVRARFEETGRFDAFNFAWKEGDPFRPHIFWDSDIAKWIEGASYALMLSPDSSLESYIDSVIEKICEHQEADGYFNIYFSVVEPGKRFTRRTDHELYDAGHLIEAAIAYAQATGKTAFLEAMCRYADLIDKIFRKEGSASFVTPGHEEIELALVKLYRYTGSRKYLDLALFFVDRRGCQQEEQYKDFAKQGYCQDRLPVREETEAIGHAVRAVYLYCALADLYAETGDQSLLDAAHRMFNSITEKRMYITGGIGSSHAGEAFTLDYDLPNLTAYAETCAALGLALFSRRMSSIEPDGRYADTAERAMYNGFLSGMSLDGRAFFYENPLEMIPRLKSRDVTCRSVGIRLPITQRLEVFGCSCCPPNVLRFINSIADFLYSTDKDTLYIHHYMDSETESERLKICQKTEYPYEGKICFSICSDLYRKVAFRIPGWCSSFRLECNGETIECTPVRGYVTVCLPQDNNVLVLDLSLEPLVMEADPRVLSDCGCVALTYGPLVFCMESVDNGEGLRDLAVDTQSLIFDRNGPMGLPCIRGNGYRRTIPDTLYHPVSHTYLSQSVTFIPYYAFANRGESEMCVWFRES